MQGANHIVGSRKKTEKEKWGDAVQKAIEYCEKLKLI
jgi:hypothetical protein